ncbi:MAG: hypothetical protein AB1586_06085 [Pseudomonadota bacterium]|jgi:hypothetical protein
MASAGDRKTPKLPAFLVEARDRRASKRPIYKPKVRTQSSRKIDIDDQLMPDGQGERRSALMADDLLVTVFIVTVGILYVVMGGAAMWLLFNQGEHAQGLSDTIYAWLLAVFFVVIGVLQLIRCCVSQDALLARAGEMFGPQKHPFKGNRLYWIPLGPAVLITLLLHAVGVRGRPLGETNLLRQPDDDVEVQRTEDPFRDDLTIRGLSFVVGALAVAFGCFTAWVALNENPAGIEYGVCVLSAALLTYGVLQLNRAVGAADTRMARWAERWGPAQFEYSDWPGIIFAILIWILAMPVMICLAAAGVGQRPDGIDPADSGE